MGARLVTQALNPTWAGLSDTARLVLITMCQTALDHPSDARPAGLYWAGHSHLVLTLTGEDPELTACPAAERRIRRAIQELKTAGAIELVAPACRGRNAVYQVTPGPAALCSAS